MAGTLLGLAGGVAAWALSFFNPSIPFHESSQSILKDDIAGGLQPLLSEHANIYLPGSDGYGIAINRWIPWRNPSFDVVIEVAVEDDVGSAVINSTCRCSYMLC